MDRGVCWVTVHGVAQSQIRLKQLSMHACTHVEAVCSNFLTPPKEIPSNNIQDFPGGLVFNNPPFNARDMGLIPGRGTKIPHAAEQLSPHATTTELMHHSEISCMMQ